jgi:hypothetical protein
MIAAEPQGVNLLLRIAAALTRFVAQDGGGDAPSAA